MENNKNYFWAMGLIALVIVIQWYFFTPTPPAKPAQAPATQQETKQSTTPGTPTGDASKPATTNPFDVQTETKAPETKETTPLKDTVQENIVAESVGDVVVDTDLFKATFTNEGAGLKSFVLKNYHADQLNKKEPAPLMDLVSEKAQVSKLYPFYFPAFDKGKKDPLAELNTKNFVYTGSPEVVLSGSEKQTAEITFKYADVETNTSVYKTFTITNNSYVMGLDYKVVINGTEQPNAPVIFGPDIEKKDGFKRAMHEGLKFGYNSVNGDYDAETIVKYHDGAKGLPAKTDDSKIIIAQGTLPGPYNWVAYDKVYFTAMFRASGAVNYYILKQEFLKERKDEPQEVFYSYLILNHPGVIYLGPKDESVLSQLGEAGFFANANTVVDYGWKIFGDIAKYMGKGVVFIYGYVPNYGWALILFTILVKIILFPLTYTSSKSMAKMQTLQPKIKAIKKKYKDLKDPEQRRQMNQETMELYKTEKVNPAGGCLPMLLQMPILIAFFRLVPMSIHFRHEPWILWIGDLSYKDPLYILPVLMAATQIIVQKMSPTSGDNAQQKMMYLMPIFMLFFFYDYASGLMLYWIISNVLQMAQQHFINKKIYQQKKEEDKLIKAQKRKKGVKSK